MGCTDKGLGVPYGRGFHVAAVGVHRHDRPLDDEAHYLYSLVWYRIVPHSAKLRGWTITPSHFLSQQLDVVWLSEK